MKQKYVHAAKKAFDENNLDLREMKIDVWMHKWMRSGWLEWFLSLDFIKRVLMLPVVLDTVSKIKPFILKIFLVLGWIFVISGLIGIFSFLVQLTSIPFVFSFGVFAGLRVVIYVVISLARSILSLLMGLGCIRRKVWFPFLMVVACGLSLASLLIAIIPSGLYSSIAYGSFSGAFFNLILTFCLCVVVIKNKEIFSS